MTRRLLAALWLASLLACARARPDLERFVTQYVSSVHEGTEFYQRATPPEDREVVELSRSRMTGDFKITGMDDGLGNVYEYAVTFSNGEVASVTVFDRKDGIQARLHIVRPPQ